MGKWGIEMIVTVQLFAGARESAGADHVQVTLEDSARFADLALVLAATAPRLEPLLKYARFAANAEYVRPEDAIDPKSEIALIPPVSGG